MNKENKTRWKLEQLECLRSEDTPCRLMITHTIKSYWIPSQKKTVKVGNLKNSPKFQNLKQTLHVTHLLKLLEKMRKYEKDPMNIVERYKADNILSTDGQTDKVKPVYPLSTSLKRGV